MDRAFLIRATLDPTLLFESVVAEQSTLRALLGAPTHGPVVHVQPIAPPPSATYGVQVVPRVYDGDKLAHNAGIYRLSRVIDEGSIASWSHDATRAEVQTRVAAVGEAVGVARRQALLELARALTG